MITTRARIRTGLMAATAVTSVLFSASCSFGASEEGQLRHMGFTDVVKGDETGTWETTIYKCQVALFLTQDTEVWLAFVDARTDDKPFTRFTVERIASVNTLKNNEQFVSQCL